MAAFSVGVFSIVEEQTWHLQQGWVPTAYVVRGPKLGNETVGAFDATDEGKSEASNFLVQIMKDFGARLPSKNRRAEWS